MSEDFAGKLTADLADGNAGGPIEPEPILSAADDSFAFGENASFDFGMSAEAGDPVLDEEIAAHDDHGTAFDFGGESESTSAPALDLSMLSPFQASKPGPGGARAKRIVDTRRSKAESVGRDCISQAGGSRNPA